jgi:succinyl-CoA synthetase beta subunit
VRFLNVHEHVSMELMRKFDVPVPRGAVATSPEQAEHVYRTSLGGGGECTAPRAALPC